MIIIYFNVRARLVISPMCRTVSDAVYVLDAIVGFDPWDDKATGEASKYIPRGGYAQFLKSDGLKGKRLGIVRNQFFKFDDELVAKTFEHHLQTLRWLILTYKGQL